MAPKVRVAAKKAGDAHAESQHHEDLKKIEKTAVGFPYDIDANPGKLRKWIFDNVTEKKWFDAIVLLAIFVNCIFLAISRPPAWEAESKQEKEADNIAFIAEIAFAVIFTLEMLLKWITLGFFANASKVHPGGYFKDPWNNLDFIIVVSGYLTMLPGVGNISSIRILRVLRPLRAVNGIPGLKIMVDTLLTSFAALQDVGILILFLLTIYAIMGVQLWSGVLHNRCYPLDLANIPNVDGKWAMIPDTGHICSLDTAPGGYKCAADEICLPYSHNPNNGLMSFDNVFSALLILYQNMSLTDWTKTMYSIQDAWGVYAVIYFVSLVLMMSFFAINLVLAVIFAAFAESKDKATAQIAAEAQGEIVIDPDAMSTETKMKTLDIAKNFEEGAIIKHKEKVKQNLDEMKKTKRMSLAVYAQHARAEQRVRKRAAELKAEQDRMGGICDEAIKLETAELEWISVYMKGKPRFVQSCYRIVEHKYFTAFIIACIVLNTIFLAMDHHGIHQEWIDFLEISNYVLTSIFTLEMVLKLIAYGPSGYKRDPFNVFDAVVVVLSLLEFTPIFGEGGGVSAFRAFRLLRVFKLAKNLKALQILLLTVVQSLESIFYMTLLLFLFVFMFGVLGVQLFGGLYNECTTLEAMENPQKFECMWPPPTSSTRYDDLYWSMFSVFQILTGDDWPNVMRNAYQAGGAVAIPFMLLVHAFGAYIIISLFVSVILDGFGSQDVAVFELLDMRDFSKKWITEGQLKDEQESGEPNYHLPKDFDHEKFHGKLMIEFQKQLDDAKTQKQKRAQQRKQMSKKKTMMGKACNIWTPESKLRIMMYNIITDPIFEWFIVIVILLNCVFLAFENPYNSDSWVFAIEIADYIFTAIFTIELIFKCIALGIYEERDSYLKDNWNRLDAFVVVVSLLSLGLPEVAVMRAFRAVRPIRVIIRSDRVKVVVQSLWNAIPAIGNVLVFCALFWLIFGILGVSLFGGKFYRCNDPSITLKADCWGTSLDDEGVEYPLKWETPPQNFDDIGRSMRTLFQVATLSSWNDVMHSAVDAISHEEWNPMKACTDPDTGEMYTRAKCQRNNPGFAIFFLLFIVVCSFFTLNLFVGVVIDNFNRLKQEFDGSALLTEEQLRAAKAQKRLKSMKLHSEDPRPSKTAFLGKWRNHSYTIVKWEYFDPLIMACIILNCITMAMEHYKMDETLGAVLDGFNLFFVIIFTCEMLLKVFGLTWKIYWAEPWNNFDFVLVWASFPKYIFPNLGGALNVIRLFRIGRIFRLIKKAKNLQRLFETLVESTPALGNIGVFLFSIFFIYSILAVSFFGTVAHSDGGLSEWANFGDFGTALLAMYRVATGDGWHEMPNGCFIEKPLCGKDEYGNNTCGNELLSTVFFNSFTVIGSLVMVNLFIAVILENFGNAGDDVMNDNIALFRDQWTKFDRYATELITPEDLHEALMNDEISPFFGNMLSKKCTVKETLTRMTELKIALRCETPPEKCTSYARFLKSQQGSGWVGENKAEGSTPVPATVPSEKDDVELLDFALQAAPTQLYMAHFKTTLGCLMQYRHNFEGDEDDEENSVLRDQQHHTYDATIEITRDGVTTTCKPSSFVRRFFIPESFAEEEDDDEEEEEKKEKPPAELVEFVFFEEWYAATLIQKAWKRYKDGPKKAERKSQSKIESITFAVTQGLIEFIDADGNVIEKDKDGNLLKKHSMIDVQKSMGGFDAMPVIAEADELDEKKSPEETGGDQLLRPEPTDDAVTAEEAPTEPAPAEEAIAVEAPVADESVEAPVSVEEVTEVSVAAADEEAAN